MRRGPVAPVDQQDPLGPAVLLVRQDQEVDRGCAGQLQTDTTQVGTVISANTIVNTPLISRNPISLSLLAPGVTTVAQESRGLAGSGSFVANGVPSIYNNYLLDGIDNNNNLTYARSPLVIAR